VTSAGPVLLGIDTTTPLGGLALAGRHGLVAEYATDVRGSHAPRVMRGVERLLADAGLAAGELGGIGVSIGPGSFTGLRVGVATAMGLARATGLPLFAVPTLEAMAWGAPASGRAVAVVMNARMGEVYGAVYRSHGEWVTALLPACAVTPEEFLTAALALEVPLAVCGTGADLLRAPTEAGLERLAILFDHPRAATIAWRAACLRERGEATPIGELRPVYLKASQAERAWARRQAEPA